MDVWSGMQKELIGNLILNSAHGGLKGKIASLILGVDLAAEGEKRSKRLKELYAEEDALLKKFADFPLAIKEQDMLRGRMIRNEIEVLEKANPIKEMQGQAFKQIENNFKAPRADMEAMNRQAQKDADAARIALLRRVQGGAAKNPAALMDANAELQKLIDEAAKRRADIDAEFENRRNGALGGIGQDSNLKSKGTFSAAAAVALGNSSNPLEQLGREQVKKLDRIAMLQEQQLREGRMMAAMV
jgi:hypothetical protein